MKQTTFDRLRFAMVVGILFCSIAAAVLAETLPFRLSLLNLSLVCCALLFREQDLIRTEQKLEEILGDSSGQIAARSLEEKLVRYHREVSRVYRATIGAQKELSKKNKNVATRLTKIIELTKREMFAQSVEVALFDSPTGSWLTSYMFGDPNSPKASGLGEDCPKSVHEITTLLTDETLEGRVTILVQPLTLGGELIGTIRVQLLPGAESDAENLKLLSLLASQCESVLIGSRFSTELLRMKELGADTQKAKTGFLANLSHELRAPLGTMLNASELLLEELSGPVNEDQKDLLRMIRQNGSHLLDLIGDVLDYAKVAAGKMQPSPESLAVGDLLTDMTHVLRSQAVQKRHSLQVLAVNPPLAVSCDKRHARQMLINLLSNAIKYTPEGGKILVSAQRLSTGQVRISVEDSGIGIPEDQKHKVFGAFERVETAYGLKQVGTGLGLSLTELLAKANLGYVSFDSKVGIGTTFHLTLPGAELSVEPVGPAADLQTVLGRGRGELVLVVDPDKQTREMIAVFLKHKGFQTAEAQSGKEILQHLRSGKLDIALIENDLPDLPGADVVHALRANPVGAKLPIVLMSARAFTFDIEGFLKIGVDRCVTKPIELSQLADTLREVIDQQMA